MARRVIGAAVALLLGAASVAYILPAEWVMFHAAQRRGKRITAGLQVELRTTTAQGTNMDERLFIRLPDGLRQEINLPDGEQITVYSPGDRWVRGPAGELRDKTRPMLWDLWLAKHEAGFESTRDQLIERLKLGGVDTEVVSLTRFEDRIVYVIGAKPGDLSVPQVWIDKFAEVPLRVVQREGEELVDIRLLEYSDFVTSGVFPQVIEVYRGDERIRRSEVVRLSLNPGLQEQLFALP